MEKLIAKSWLPPSTESVEPCTDRVLGLVAGLKRVSSVGEVFEGIQRAKSVARAYITNFFPVESRLKTWIEQRELLALYGQDFSAYLRWNRGLFHFYFCAANPEALAAGLASQSDFSRLKLVTDLVGPEAATVALAGILESNGWSGYRKLIRLSRTAVPVSPSSPTTDSSEVSSAGLEDAADVRRLIDAHFDRYADQLPSDYELLDALANKQVLVCRAGPNQAGIPALLFFETQGFTSTIRYWVVDEAFRDRRFGAALIRHYFGSQPAVRRFILWVGVENENALNKYRHYGYVPETLVDRVLINTAVAHEIAS